MLRRYRLHLLAFLLAIALTPAVASAAGGADIRDIAFGLITTFKGTWMIVAVLVIVIAGFTLMLSHEEGQLQKANKTIVGVIVGGVIITIMLFIGSYDTLISYFYNGSGSLNVLAGLPAVQLQTEGVASWVMSMAVVAAVMMIIIAMLEAVFSFGADEAAYAKVRTALLHVILALLVMISAKIIREVFFVVHEPSPLLLFMLGKIILVLGFIAFIAVAILIYAGFRMVISFGREEDFTAAKSLMIRVIIGLLIIAISFSLVWIVTTVFN